MADQTVIERRQTRFALIEKYLAGGLTQKQFCQQQQLAYSTFQFWLKKYRQIKPGAKSDQPVGKQFVPLTFGPALIHSELSFYSIEYPNGVVLYVNRAIEPAALIALLQASGV